MNKVFFKAMDSRLAQAVAVVIVFTMAVGYYIIIKPALFIARKLRAAYKAAAEAEKKRWREYASKNSRVGRGTRALIAIAIAAAVANLNGWGRVFHSIHPAAFWVWWVLVGGFFGIYIVNAAVRDHIEEYPRKFRWGIVKYDGWWAGLGNVLAIDEMIGFWVLFFFAFVFLPFADIVSALVYAERNKPPTPPSPLPQWLLDLGSWTADHWIELVLAVVTMVFLTSWFKRGRTIKTLREQAARLSDNFKELSQEFSSASRANTEWTDH